MSYSASFYYISSVLQINILCHWYRRQKKTQLHYTHALPVTVESDCTCLFITSVNKRQIANHNTDYLERGPAAGGLCSQRRVITSFMCIRGEHPWHASYWLSETSTLLSHRGTALVYLENSSLFWRYPILTQTTTLNIIQRCCSGHLEVHHVIRIVRFGKIFLQTFIYTAYYKFIYRCFII